MRIGMCGGSGKGGDGSIEANDDNCGSGKLSTHPAVFVDPLNDTCDPRPEPAVSDDWRRRRALGRGGGGWD